MQTAWIQKNLLCMLACLAGGRASFSSLNYSCDATCQQGQRSALNLLYKGCGGAYWLNSSGWREYDELPDSSWSNTAHCSWYGVLCCDLNMSSLPGFPSSSASCSSPGAVLGLALQQNNLSQPAARCRLCSSAIACADRSARQAATAQCVLCARCLQTLGAHCVSKVGVLQATSCMGRCRQPWQHCRFLRD